METTDNNQEEAFTAQLDDPLAPSGGRIATGTEHQQIVVDEGDESDSELSQLTDTKLTLSPVLLRGSKKKLEVNRSSNNSPIDFLSTSQASMGSLSSSGRPQLGDLKPPARLQHKSLALSADAHPAPLRALGAATSPKSSQHKSIASTVPVPGPVINPRHNKMSPSKEDPHSLGGPHYLTPHAPLGAPLHNKLDTAPLGEIKHSPRKELSPRTDHADEITSNHSPSAKEAKEAKEAKDVGAADHSPAHSARALGALHTPHSPSAHPKSAFLSSPQHSPLAPIKPLVKPVEEKVSDSAETVQQDALSEPVQSSQFFSTEAEAEASPPGPVSALEAPPAPDDQPSSHAAQEIVLVPVSEVLPAGEAEVRISGGPDVSAQDTIVLPLEPVLAEVQLEPLAVPISPTLAGDNEPSYVDLTSSVSASQESPLPPPKPVSPPTLTEEDHNEALFKAPPHTPVRGNLGSGSKATRFNRSHMGEPSVPPTPDAGDDGGIDVEPTPQKPVVPVLHTPPPLPLAETISVGKSNADGSPRTSPRTSPRISPRLPSPRGAAAVAVPSPAPLTLHGAHLTKKHSYSNMSVSGTVTSTSERTYGTMNRSVHSVAQPSSNYEASYNKAASDLRAALLNLDADVANTKTIVRNIFRKFGVDEHAEMTVKELKGFVLSPELGLFNHDDPRAIKFATMLMEQIDINGDGSVSLSELESFLWPRVITNTDTAPAPLSHAPFMFQSPWEKAHNKPTDIREIGIVIDFTRTAVRNHVSSVAALGSDEAILQEFAKFAKATLKRGMLDTRLVKKSFLNIKINEFGRCLYQQEVDQLVASIDCNDDGVVSASEFKHWLFPSLKQEENDALAKYLKKILNESFGGDVWQMYRAFSNGSEQCYKSDFVLVLKAIDKNISKQEAMAMANKIAGSDKSITMAHMLAVMDISAKSLQNADASSTGNSHAQSSSAEADAFGTPRTRRRRRRAAEHSSRLATHEEESGEIAGALFGEDDDGAAPAGDRKSQSLLMGDEGEINNPDDCSDMSDDASELSFDSAMDGEGGRADHFLASSNNGLGVSDAAVRMNAAAAFAAAAIPADPALTPSEREKQRVRELLYGDKGKALQASLSATNISFAEQFQDLEEGAFEGIEPVRRTVGLTPAQLTAMGYSGHKGRWRGHPYDTWSCCDTALLKCPFDDGEAFSPGAGSPSKVRTSLDSSTGSLFYKAKATPFLPAGRSPAKTSLGEIREATPPPMHRKRSPSPRKPLEKPARTQPSPAQQKLAAKFAPRKLTSTELLKPKAARDDGNELLITPARLQARQAKAQPKVSKPAPAPRRAAPAPRALIPVPAPAPAPVPAAPVPLPVCSKPVVHASVVPPRPLSQIRVASRSTPYVSQAPSPSTAMFTVTLPRPPSPVIQSQDVELFQHLNASPPVIEAHHIELKSHARNPTSPSATTSPFHSGAAEAFATAQGQSSIEHSRSPASKAYENTLKVLRDELSEARVDTFEKEFELHSALREEEPTLRIHQALLDKAAAEKSIQELFEEHKGEKQAEVQDEPGQGSPHHAFHDEWTRYQSEEKKAEVEERLEINVDRSTELSITGLSFQLASRMQTALQDIHEENTELKQKYGAQLRIGSVDSPYLPDDARSPNKYYKAPPQRRQRSQSAPPSSRTHRVSSNSNSNTDSFFSAQVLPPRAVVRDDVGAVRPATSVSKVVAAVAPMHHPGAWLPTSPLHGTSFYRTNRQSRRSRHTTLSPQRARSAPPAQRRREAVIPSRNGKSALKKRSVPESQPQHINSQPAPLIYPSSVRDMSSFLRAEDTPRGLSYGALPDQTNPDRTGYDALFAPPAPTQSTPLHKSFVAPLPAHIQFPPPYVSPVPQSFYQPSPAPVYAPSPAPVYVPPPSPAYSTPYAPADQYQYSQYPQYPQYQTYPAYSAAPVSYPSMGYMPNVHPVSYGTPVYAPPSYTATGTTHAIDTWWEQIRAQKRQHEIHGYDSVQSSLSNKM